MSSRSLLVATSALAFYFSACRSVPTPTCFPARGSEVWVERHVRAQQPSKAGYRVDLHIARDTSSTMVASDPDEVILLVTRPGAPTPIVARVSASADHPATVRLAEG